MVYLSIDVSAQRSGDGYCQGIQMVLLTAALRRLLCASLLLTLVGCATAPQSHPSDPFESVNRSIDKFNRSFDKAIARPVAKGYRFILPDPIDTAITNFFANIDDINSAINNLLQIKPARAVSDMARIAVNTTFGLLGFIDLATPMGIPSYKEDLGQTLGFWGVGDTPYLVIPILGPDTLRDFIGGLGDLVMNPIYYTEQGIYWSLLVLRFIDTRAGLLETTDVLEAAAVDPYAFIRETYLQVRHNQIHDGTPPLDEEFIDEEIRFDDE